MSAGALAGKRIVVTRPAGQAEGLASLIRAAGGEPLLVPAIEIRPLDDAGAAGFSRFAERLEDFDLAVFVSRNAVQSGLRLLREKRGAKPWPQRLRVATVGQGSRAALEAEGFTGVIAPEGRADSEGLLARPELAGLRGRRVAILRGDAGRELLGEELARRGAAVEYIACYLRARPSSAGVSRLGRERVDAVTVSSAEGLANFLDLLGADAAAELAHAPFFVPHPRVAEQAARRGIAKAVVAGPGDAEVAAALVAYFGGAR